jgi:hypothetical protein
MKGKIEGRSKSSYGRNGRSPVRGGAALLDLKRVELGIRGLKPATFLFQLLPKADGIGEGALRQLIIAERT